MRDIAVSLDAEYIRKNSSTAGVQGSGNVNGLVITFSPDWDEFAKTVTWWDANGHNPVKQIVGADLIVDITKDPRTYRLPIPPEPLAVAGFCAAVVDGYLDGMRARSVIIDLEVLYAPVAENAGDPTDPTPSQAEQLQGEIDGILSEIADYATEAKSWAVGDTGSREGEDTDNAMYYAGKAADLAKAAGESEEAAGRSASAAAASAQSAAASADTASAAMENAQSAASAASVIAQAAAGSAKAAQEAQEASEIAREEAKVAQSGTQSAATAASQSAASAQQSAAAASAASTAAQSAKETAQSAAGTAASQAQTAVQAADDADEDATLSRSWAVGGTGTRAGEDTNNAKYWSEAAQGAASGGVSSFKGRSGAVVPQDGDYTADMVGARSDTWIPTADQVGADPAGSSAKVMEFLNSHVGNTKNPHGVTAVQVGAARPGTAFTVLLPASGWSGNQQIVSDDRFIASGYAYIVTPGDDDFGAWTNSLIRGLDVTTEGKMTFVCSELPAEDITVKIIRLEAKDA